LVHLQIFSSLKLLLKDKKGIFNIS